MSGIVAVRSAMATRKIAARWNWRSTSTCLSGSSSAMCARRAELEREISARLAHMAEDEPERQVEVLRQFQRAAIFRVAMADLTATIPLMRVSDYLTEIAEIIIEQAMQLAWLQMTAQFGRPKCADNGGEDGQRRAV